MGRVMTISTAQAARDTHRCRQPRNGIETFIGAKRGSGISDIRGEGFVPFFPDS